MFLAETLTTVAEGLKRTFTNDYPVSDFRDLYISPEYPAAEAEYPAIWIGFEPSGAVVRAGIDHREHLEHVTDDVTTFGEITRWRFEGMVQYTILSLSSLARARLVDEVIKVVGFGPLAEGRAPFRSFLEDNPLIALQMNYDSIEFRGQAETPGTPWGTDDVLYEVTLSSRVIGEFVSSESGIMVPLREVRVYATLEGEAESDSPDLYVP